MKVYYKGQRGEGVYDVAFEGLLRNVERRYRETGSETMKAEYEDIHEDYAVQCLQRAEAKTGSAGSNCRRITILPN